MVIEIVAAKRSKTHTRYFKKSGTLVPGVTTVIGVLAKPALYPWHNKMGLAGIDTSKYVDVLALIGTLGHDLICCHNQQREFKPDGTPLELIDKAENCLLSYFEWAKQHKIEPILCEQQLVSEDFSYGGTVDMYALVDGVRTLLDYKTGKGIWPEHVYQVAAYRQLLQENGYPV
jgi:hypothetical protein